MDPLSHGMLAESEGGTRGLLIAALHLDRYQGKEPHPIQLVFDRNIDPIQSVVAQ